MKQSELIARRHPKYTTALNEWEFFQASYLGGRGFLDTHLTKHRNEGDEEYKARQDAAYRENHVKRVVDLISSYLFKEDAKRESSNDLLNTFFANFDGKGTTVRRFMKTVDLWASIMGRMYIVMDKRQLSADEQTGTAADNINPEAQPYCYMVFPQNVMDFALDEVGNFKWILIRETYRDDSDPFSSSGDEADRYRLWRPKAWDLYNDKGELIESGEGPKIIPIVAVDSESKNEYEGQSLIGDTAYLDRAIYNNWSRLDSIVADQTFSQLIFPIEGLPADIAKDQKLRDEFLTLATNRVILYSAMAQAPPSFISPDASQATFILDMIVTQVKQLYGSQGLQAETGTEVKQQSGVAKSYDFDKLNKMLIAKADNLQNAEVKLVKIFASWIEIANIECEIDYPDNFDVKTLIDDIAVAQELVLLNISQTFTEKLFKAIVQKAMPKMSNEDRSKIFEEIEADQQKENNMNQEASFDFDKEEE